MYLHIKMHLDILLSSCDAVAMCNLFRWHKIRSRDVGVRRGCGVPLAYPSQLGDFVIPCGMLRLGQAHKTHPGGVCAGLILHTPDLLLWSAA
jgi:hypothetical protein